MLADCEHICVENPVGFMNSAYRKADQIIHPYYFAESEDDADLPLAEKSPAVRTYI